MAFFSQAKPTHVFQAVELFFPFYSRLSEGVDDGWHGWHGGGNRVKTNGISVRTEPKKTKVSETFMFLVLWKEKALNFKSLHFRTWALGPFVLAKLACSGCYLNSGS